MGGDLPTEAQWEGACRAGTETAWSFGDAEEDLEEHGWYRGNSEMETHPVGEKLANPWGLQDMHGNVWEWCRDWYGPYEEGEVEDPLGPESGADRVVRGGGTWSDADGCRSAFRFRLWPWNRYDVIGFRVALPPPPMES